jgi:protein-S-isoprenylcysteine O-methyltransferase Ste14
MTLKARAVRRLATTLIVLAILLFIPGSLRFWQGWILWGLTAVSWSIFFAHFLKHDPQLLERRLQRRETEPQQKLFQKLFGLLMWAGFIIAGLDFRFGWSRLWLRPVPYALVAAAQVTVLGGYDLVFRVMKTNTFAASIIRVEQHQTVIERGPYALVRHPMYTGMGLAALATPLALGSYIALPLFALMLPGLIYRLIHEERTLRRDLPDYADYCRRTTFRLVPGVW